jgi:hypothetical protein
VIAMLQTVPAPATSATIPAPPPATSAPPRRRATFEEIARKLLAAAENYRALGVKLSTDQARRIPCVLRKLLDPATDDRAILMDVFGYTIRLMATRHLDPQQWQFILTPLRAHMTDLGNQSLNLGSTDAEMLNFFRQFFDEQIARQIGWLRLQEYPLGGGATVAPGIVDIHDWVSKRQSDGRSVYSCYT